ncbi:MAG: trehalose-6-phosphate synthase [Gammaproteobacteria bacterium]|nr:trehalose-6-phosphate synthase [Gammaproteobacteria bacterium]MCP5424789.1 trehalose-6-phosphate synthase [Gammaproteobacteria bacterium]MCP5458234.1 trehalose-6-phosphate synthase [Gammaproteobacteria bacterium]
MKEKQPDISNDTPDPVAPADLREPLIVIASNRGPYSFKRNEDGQYNVQRGAGGLVTALAALAERHQVLWVAAALSEDDRAWVQQRDRSPQNVEGILLQLFEPDKVAYDKFYNQIANPLLWFIQHQLWDTPRYPSIDGDTWDAWHNGYVAINRQFADAIVASVKASSDKRPVLILPQDYQLYLVPQLVREQLGEQVQIQPFCHIPWPGPDAWRILPAEMRDQLLHGLLASDRVGFQTRKDAFNFVQTCRFYLPDAHSRGSRSTIHYQDRNIEAKAYPISVDVEKVESIAEEMETRLFKNQLINSIGDSRLILRTDRVEPSKNILRSLQAFRLLLERYPEHRGKVKMLTLLVPSRMEVGEYITYLKEITAEASLIDADFSDGFWEPVRLIFGDNYHRAIAAMQLYDVLMVNPLADGMNLVAKEGVLVNQRDGVLLLSEYAGAFYELGDQAMTVSPFDIHSTAEILHQALTMPAEEKSRRAEALRSQVRHASVKLWFKTQVDDALAGLRQTHDPS